MKHDYTTDEYERQRAKGARIWFYILMAVLYLALAAWIFGK